MARSDLKRMTFEHNGREITVPVRVVERRVVEVDGQCRLVLHIEAPTHLALAQVAN